MSALQLKLEAARNQALHLASVVTTLRDDLARAEADNAWLRRRLGAARWRSFAMFLALITSGYIITSLWVSR